MVKKAKIESLCRAHIFFTGRVQGVGFRYESEAIAQRVGGLTGFVKNLPDGRVELVCEGEKERVDRLMNCIKESFLGKHIKKMDCFWEAPTRQYSDFIVEFHL